MVYLISGITGETRENQLMNYVEITPLLGDLAAYFGYEKNGAEVITYTYAKYCIYVGKRAFYDRTAESIANFQLNP